MGLESAGGLALHIILSKLGPDDTAVVACVSKSFNVWASDDSLWSQFCAQELGLSFPKDPLGNHSPSFKAAYQSWREAFSMYPWSLVTRVKRCWDRLKGWLRDNFPEILATLREGVSENEIRELEKSLKVKLPLPTRILYRLCDGQDLTSQESVGSLLGLIGGYSFYDYLVNVCLFPLSQVMIETKDTVCHLKCNTSSRYIVVAGSTYNEKIFYLNCTTGQLYVGTQNFTTESEMLPCVPDALISSVHDCRGSQQQDGILLWLEEHCRRLQHGIIKIRKEGRVKSISLYPEQPPLCSTAVTNGVKVRASAVFVPEFSDLHHGDHKYLFSYSIRMSLLPGGCMVNGKLIGSCQLYWRHWIICAHDAVVSDVNAEAVIGKFPLLHSNGEEFVYESCTLLPSSSGSIKGSFIFVPGSLADPKGDPFEVEVAPVPLQLPDYIF